MDKFAQGLYRKLTVRHPFRGAPGEKRMTRKQRRSELLALGLGPDGKPIPQGMIFEEVKESSSEDDDDDESEEISDRQDNAMSVDGDVSYCSIEMDETGDII